MSTLKEAILIAKGETMMLPTRAHIKALYDRLERSFYEAHDVPYRRKETCHWPNQCSCPRCKAVEADVRQELLDDNDKGGEDGDI